MNERYIDPRRTQVRERRGLGNGRILVSEYHSLEIPVLVRIHNLFSQNGLVLRKSEKNKSPEEIAGFLRSKGFEVLVRGKILTIELPDNTGANGPLTLIGAVPDFYAAYFYFEKGQKNHQARHNPQIL